LRSENPPEGARILQGYTIGTKEHIVPTGFIGFHRNLKNLQRVEKGSLTASDRAQRGSENRGRLTERGKERGMRAPELSRGQWPPVAGDRRKIARSRGSRRETESNGWRGRN
jgi:hypothetical protein